MKPLTDVELAELAAFDGDSHLCDVTARAAEEIRALRQIVAEKDCEIKERAAQNVAELDRFDDRLAKIDRRSNEMFDLLHRWNQATAGQAPAPLTTPPSPPPVDRDMLNTIDAIVSALMRNGLDTAGVRRDLTYSAVRLERLIAVLLTKGVLTQEDLDRSASMGGMK